MSDQKIIVRSDDVDPRINVDDLIYIHSLFLANGIPFTIAINNVAHYLYEFDPKVIDYINSTEGWDIQLHGFKHDHLWYFARDELYQNIFTNLHLTKQLFPKANPTVFSPPWNEVSAIMNKVCAELGLTVHTTGTHIRFWLNWKRRDPNVIFIHWWDLEDLKLLPALFAEIKGPDSPVVLPPSWQVNP